jgi:hypothetical protein
MIVKMMKKILHSEENDKKASQIKHQIIITTAETTQSLNKMNNALKKNQTSVFITRKMQFIKI